MECRSCVYYGGKGLCWVRGLADFGKIGCHYIKSQVTAK